MQPHFPEGAICLCCFSGMKTYLLTLNCKSCWEKAVPSIPGNSPKKIKQKWVYQFGISQVGLCHFPPAGHSWDQQVIGPSAPGSCFFSHSVADDSVGQQHRDMRRMFWLTHVTDEEEETAWQHWWTSSLLQKCMQTGVKKSCDIQAMSKPTNILILG